MVKRTITISMILLIISLAIGLIITISGMNFAADDDIASGTSGTCSWVIDSEGVLTISPTDGVSGLLETNVPWGQYKSAVTKVIVNNGVKANTRLEWFFNGLGIALK